MIRVVLLFASPCRCATSEFGYVVASRPHFVLQVETRLLAGFIEFGVLGVSRFQFCSVGRPFVGDRVVDA
jgi:hypothetical protein